MTREPSNEEWGLPRLMLPKGTATTTAGDDNCPEIALASLWYRNAATDAERATARRVLAMLRAVYQTGFCAGMKAVTPP